LNDGNKYDVFFFFFVLSLGNDVSVGSGFSLQKRLDYANHPDLILGKLITVQYFSESLGDSGNLSLRFPSVKAVYDDGRD
jgi:DNA ligase-1